MFRRYRRPGLAAVVASTTAVTALLATLAHADSTAARCDIYARGNDHSSATTACVFSQRQGFISIQRADGVNHHLSPVKQTVGAYTDEQGRPVLRQSGLGDQGLIFRLPDESVYVYWNTGASTTELSVDNPTAPFTTENYDATALLRCRAVDANVFGQCPAGILRMENQQASIVVLGPDGEQFTINFMTDYINATNRAVEAKLIGDTWVLSFANGEVWEVPVAAIEGG